MTLTEFLLARVAEDEAAVDGITSGAGPDFQWGPDRIHVECEAKRRIIEWAAENAHRIDSEWGDGCSVEEIRAERCGDYGNGALVAALKALALPYVDHPDCREEWHV